MIFYVCIIKPYVYFNALAYIASRKQAYERKEREGLSNNHEATVDFPGNNEDSMDKDLIAGNSD